MNISALTVVGYFFWALAIAAFVVEAWAFIDAVRRPRAAYTAAGKQTKPIWLLILGVALAIGLAGAVNLITIISVLPIVAFVAAAIYLVDVRPKVRALNASQGQRMGPYGPW